MEKIFRICLAIVGIINFIPSIIAFIPSKISSSYGVEVPNINYELLLRHRAVLFGIVGGIMIYSAATKKHYGLAVLFGTISMTSFLFLYFLIGEGINSELAKVMKIDVVAIIILIFGGTFYLKDQKTINAKQNG